MQVENVWGFAKAENLRLTVRKVKYRLLKSNGGVG